MQLLSTIRRDHPIQKVVLHAADGRLITCSSIDGSFQLWELSNDLRSAKLAGELVWNNSLLANRARLDPQQLPKFQNGQLINQAVDVAFHPDGKTFACIGPGECVQVRRWPDASVLRSFGEPGQFARLAFSPDGQVLIASGWVSLEGDAARNRMAVFDYSSGKVRSIASHAGRVLAIHPEGKIVATAINDQGTCQIRCFSLDNQMRMFRRVAEIYTDAESLTFDPAGVSLAISGEEEFATLHVVDFVTLSSRFRRQLTADNSAARLYRTPQECRFSADGLRLWRPSPSGALVEFDAVSGASLQEMNLHKGAIQCTAAD